MPHILKMGKVEVPQRPWFEETIIMCADCDAAFMIEQCDLDNGTWKTGVRISDGHRTAEGYCPCCASPMTVDVTLLLRETDHSRVTAMHEGLPQVIMESIDESG